MPSINMIAPRRSEKQRLQRDVSRLTIVIMAELVLIVLMSGWMMARVYSTKAGVAQLNAELDKLQPVVRKIASFESSTKDLEPKVDLLADARESTMRWYCLLDKLSTSMARSTWVTRISTAPALPDSTEAVINVNGVSANQELVGETMLRLHSNPDISNIDLHYTQTTLLGMTPAVEFELAAVLKTVEPEEAKKGETDSAVAKS